MIAGALALMAALVLVLAPGEVEADCKVGGPLAGGYRCTFNNVSNVPGRKCVRVVVASPDGETASSRTCSGLLWGGEVKEVPISGFNPDPRAVCPMWKNCTSRTEEM
jgi:hypothetical protein